MHFAIGQRLKMPEFAGMCGYVDRSRYASWTGVGEPSVVRISGEAMRPATITQTMRISRLVLGLLSLVFPLGNIGAQSQGTSLVLGDEELVIPPGTHGLRFTPDEPFSYLRKDDGSSRVFWAGGTESTAGVTSACDTQDFKNFIPVILSANKAVAVMLPVAPKTAALDADDEEERLQVNQTSFISNLSVRTTMTSDQTLFVGGAISEGRKTILARAGGPALNKFGLQGMVDPRLELYTSGATLTASNDDWPSSLTIIFASVGAFSYPVGSRDSALSQTINGPFTVQAKGTGAGAVLVELYDLSAGEGVRLINVSARNKIGTGADVLIAGFNIAGEGGRRLLIRGIGPGLAQFGVTGTLVDPKVQVFDSNNGVVVTNDNWDTSLTSVFASVGAFGLLTGSKDAGLDITLQPGSYSVVVSGADGGTGEGIVEVYELP
jgi:hypothetical protein